MNSTIEVTTSNLNFFLQLLMLLPQDCRMQWFSETKFQNPTFTMISTVTLFPMKMRTRLFMIKFQEPDHVKSHTKEW
jgi:hypothetical protein